MDSEMYQALTVGVTQLFLGAYVLLIVEMEQPRWKWLLRWGVLVFLLITYHVTLIAVGRYDLYVHYAVLTYTVPYALVTTWCDRYHGIRSMFSVANAAYVGCIAGTNGHLAEALFPGVPFLGLAVRVISLIALYFVLRSFSHICRKMMRQLDHGWVILCLIPMTTSLITLYISQQCFPEDPLAATIVIYGLLALCGYSYYLMYLFFDQVEQESSSRYEAQLSDLQLSALRSRMNAVNTAENTIRTERHDLRHRLKIVAELVARGEQAEALNFLSEAQEKLNEHQPTRWCRPPVLDAVFASYFRQAQQQDIRVDAQLALPSALSVNEGELAIVLANTLENAIHANMELPSQERMIRCRVVSAPSLMLEVSNPCHQNVAFDEQGLPVSTKEGHGLGMQSLSFFCHKHGAVYQFILADGWFRMRLVL